MLFWYVFKYSYEDWACVGVRKCQCEYSRGYSVGHYFSLLLSDSLLSTSGIDVS